MEIQSAWLIYNKASLEEYSPMNLDGSEFMVGVGVVAATSIQEALSKFDEYLASQKMAIMDVSKCEKYDPANFTEPTEDNADIKEVIPDVLENDKIFYVCGISSQALEAEDGND